MLITTSYQFKIVSQMDKFNNEISLNKKALKDTINIFRNTLSYCIDIVFATNPLPLGGG